MTGSTEFPNHRYKATITMRMPGHQKDTVYPLDVEAPDLTMATEKMQQAWNEAVEIREYSIKEVPASKQPGKIIEA